MKLHVGRVRPMTLRICRLRPMTMRVGRFQPITIPFTNTSSLASHRHMSRKSHDKRLNFLKKRKKNMRFFWLLYMTVLNTFCDTRLDSSVKELQKYKFPWKLHWSTRIGTVPHLLSCKENITDAKNLLQIDLQPQTINT